MNFPLLLGIAGLADRYREGSLRPTDVAAEVLRRIEACRDPAVWISRVGPTALMEAAETLEREGPGPDRPLWGIPFAVKDNIDCAGLPTTAACPAFEYRPGRDAATVARLKAAGALLVGKTNLDQFATGLNGTRSPYGAPRCVFDADYVSGGSSSGSAVAVGAGLVSFALGTDTAGSGRVPAAFNNLVGIKPTRGLLSTAGVVPACRSLDCVTVFAATVADGDLVRRVAQGFDAEDPFSRLAARRGLPTAAVRFGVLRAADREFYGDAACEALYLKAIAALEAAGWTAVEIDYAPFRDSAELLYGGPWVGERIAAVGDFAAAHPAAVEPTVRAILEGGRGQTAADAFRGQYRLAALRRRAEAEWARMDVLLLPTAPTQYRVADMQERPVELNSRLGLYTNFVNLLDCAAVAVPAGFRPDGLPFGVTLIAPAFSDDDLALLADRVHRVGWSGSGIDRGALRPPGMARPQLGDDEAAIAVVGAHLSGMPLNGELVRAGGRFMRTARTAADYRLYVLPGTTPAKPGLARSPGHVGPGIELEEWALPLAEFGRFVAAIPAPLGIGRITLEDGRQVSGFLCEAHALANAQEITGYGGWRGYVGRTGP
jgi:allophanate hydrolase